MHVARDVPAEGRELLDAARGDEAVLGAGHDVDRLDLLRLTAVELVHLELVFEVRDGAQAVGFLGLRMACAQCHHHPYEKWSQDDYWGLAAFFGRVGRKNVPVPGGFQNQLTTREAIYTGILSFGRTLAADRHMQTRIETMVEQVALAAVPWRGQIGALIAEVVRGWDPRTVAHRVELAIGSDLQYIRMTGTLVGACVGCVLYLLSYYLF